LEFSFTDGVNWDGPYKLMMEVPEKLKGLPQSYFNEVSVSVRESTVDENLHYRILLCPNNSFLLKEK
jgi:hypothetical protein